MIQLIGLHFASRLIAHVAEPAMRSLVFASLAGLALATFRPKSISVQLAIWTVVLYAALAMPFLGWLLPAVPLRLPATGAAQQRISLAAATYHAAAPPAITQTGGSSAGLQAHKAAVISPSELSSANGRAVPAAQPFGGQIFWPAILVCGYFLVAAILLSRFALGIILSRRLRRASALIDDPHACALLERNGQNLGITSLPSLAESNSVVVPATLGLRRPAILLPSGWRQWGEAKLSAVLVHELSHVRRHDARTQALSVVHHCVFWFSPLAWWLDRKLEELAEEASDEAALRAGADATYYAEVLLGFFAALGTAGRRVRWQAISLVRGSRAERRLDRMFRANIALPGSLRKSALALLLACAAPAVCFIAAVRPSAMGAQPAFAASGETLPQAQPQAAPAAPQKTTTASPSADQAPPPEPPVPAAPNPQFGRTVFPKGMAREIPLPPSAPPQPASAPLPAPAMLAALPPLPASPPGPMPPAAVQSVSSPSDAENGAWFFNGNGGPDYAIVSGKSFFMSGSGGERDEVNAIRNKIKGNFIWFRSGAKSYIIEDPATVREAVEFFAPEEELGKEQATLGKQQAALGKHMQAIRVQIPSGLVAQLQRVEAAIKEIGPNGNQQELGHLQGELGRAQGEIGRLQGEAGTQDGAIGREMGALGRQQGALGREQGRLGRQQGRMARQANREMRRLIDSALARGIAKPAP